MFEGHNSQPFGAMPQLYKLVCLLLVDTEDFGLVAVDFSLAAAQEQTVDFVSIPIGRLDNLLGMRK